MSGCFTKEITACCAPAGLATSSDGQDTDADLLDRRRLMDQPQQPIGHSSCGRP